MTSFFLQLATFFGAGKLPKAPGTWGTLACLPLVIFLMWLGPFWHMGFCLALVPVSIIASQIYENIRGEHDASEIVIDEVLGFAITMVWLPLTWQSVLAGFVLFRALDMLKPWPISHLDRKVSGGVGVVVDDVAAGLIANVILQIVATQTLWLGLRSGGL